MERLTTATLFLVAFQLVTIQPTTIVVNKPTENATTVSLDTSTRANPNSLRSVPSPLTAIPTPLSESSPSSTSPNPTSTSTTPTSTTLPPVTHNSTVRNYDWVIALIVLTSVGILSVVGIELYIHIKICCTPLMRQGTSLWLGHALLFAIFLSYLLLYAFVPYPSSTTCAIIRFCLGVCYSLCFAVLLVKLILILCPEDVPAAVSAVLLLFVWLVQVVIDIQWLIRDPPEVTRVANADGCACTPGFTEHVKTLVYVMVLIVLTLCACVVARCNGSDVTDDALYIGLSSGITVIVWVIWILLGYLKNDTEWHDPCLAFGLLVTVTVLLIVVFVPKLHQLNRLRDVDWDLPVDDVKADPTTIPEAFAFKGDSVSITTSGSKRSLGSVETAGWNGEIPYRSGNWAARNTVLEMEYGGAEPAFPPNLDPRALHLQYPSSPEPNLKRWGSIHSAPSGYEPSRTGLTTQGTLRASMRSNSKQKNNHTVAIQVVNHNHKVNQNQVNHKVNHNQKVNHNHVSYVVNHNPNPTMRSKILVKH